jgi:hypothetical protein
MRLPSSSGRIASSSSRAASRDAPLDVVVGGGQRGLPLVAGRDVGPREDVQALELRARIRT